jgi:hypothetical protein
VSSERNCGWGGSGVGGTEEEYVHLDTGDLAYLELSTDKEAT